MVHSNVLSYSEKIYFQLEEELLKNISNEDIDLVSTGFMYFLYESFLRQLHNGDSIDNHYNFLLQMYKRELPMLNTKDKLEMFNATTSVLSLIKINDYLSNLMLTHKKLGPIKCKYILNLSKSICSDQNTRNNLALEAQFRSILNTLEEISPRSRIFISQLKKQYCKDMPPTCGGVRTLYDDIIGIINFFILPIDYLIYLYQKW